jgi:hypothetical protein
LQQNQILWYSYKDYPVGHSHDGWDAISTKYMTEAEYQDLVHHYKGLHEKTNYFSGTLK